jgi:hypothetical protein
MTQVGYGTSMKMKKTLSIHTPSIAHSVLVSAGSPQPPTIFWMSSKATGQGHSFWGTTIPT